MMERLQKILSARGIASRRKAEEYIEAGLVKVNGIVATLGQKADPEKDEITVDGKVTEARKEMLYYVMYKPRGVETTNVEKVTGYGLRVEGEGERGKEKEVFQKSRNPQLETRNSSVRDLLPPTLRGKLYPVGRLDKDSEGLLLLTNDGVLAYRLTHPKFDHEKEYDVETVDPITDGQILKLRKGITLFGEKTKPAVVTRLGPARFRIALTEGRNRQIRRMTQKVGGEVKTLTRVRIVTFTDAALKPGGVRPLTTLERDRLLQALKMTSETTT